MTQALDRATVDAVLDVAVRAPSIHNTQPWAWRLDSEGLALLADRTRQLAIADPDGHSLLISCGAALHLTELALRAKGWQVSTRLLPDPPDPDVLAVFDVTGHGKPDERSVEQVDAALARRSDRRPFAQHEVSTEVIEVLRSAGSDAAARVDFPTGTDERINLAVAVSWADRVERDDQAYRDEMNQWIRDPDVHAVVDGVPLQAIPHVPVGSPRHTDVPLRDFEVGMTGQQLITQDVDEQPLIAVVFTDSDTAADHLRSGQALMRLLIEAQLQGLATCVLSQAVDFAAFRTRVQGLMGWVGFPQIMVRVGYPGAPLADLMRTPRRDRDAVLHVA